MDGVCSGSKVIKGTDTETRGCPELVFRECLGNVQQGRVNCGGGCGGGGGGGGGCAEVRSNNEWRLKAARGIKGPLEREGREAAI